MPRASALSTLGETRLLQRIREWCPVVDPAVLLGIGDDAAVIRPRPGKVLLLTTDLLIEHVHFTRRTTTMADLGWKALAVSLSDLAAMGSRPRACLLSLALPPRLSVHELRAFYRGLGTLARRYAITVVGGDLSASPAGMAISVTATGEAEEGRVVTRGGAHAGDHLYVTGTLGDSAAGLHLLRRGSARRPRQTAGGASTLLARHLRPRPRVDTGMALAAHQLATAMIDLSDGLATDLRRLCHESHTGAELELGHLPMSVSLRRHARAQHQDPVAYALGGGEDYELLFTVGAGRAEEVAGLARDLRVPMTRIGRILPRRAGVVVLTVDGRRRPLRLHGYEHFGGGRR